MTIFRAMAYRLLPLLAVGLVACGPPPLELPDDPAQAGAPVGVRQIEARGQTLSVFYPAPERSAGKDTWHYSLDAFLTQAFLDEAGPFAVPMHDTGAVSAAPLREHPEDGTWPVVLFSHGFAAWRLQSASLLTHLASRGYVVVTADHPGRTLADILPCLFDPPLEGCDIIGAFANDPAPEDLVDVLDWLDSAVTERDGFFEGAIDPSTVGLFGHSAGAGTTGAFTDAEPRVVASLMLGGGVRIEREANAAIIAGTCDAVLPIDPLADSAAAMGAPIVRLKRAGHLAFSDICGLGIMETTEKIFEGRDDVNETFLGQMSGLAQDGCPGYTPEAPAPDCATEAYLPIETSDVIIKHYVTTFFDAHLKGEGEAATAGIFPEAEVVSN